MKYYSNNDTVRLVEQVEHVFAIQMQTTHFNSTSSYYEQRLRFKYFAHSEHVIFSQVNAERTTLFFALLYLSSSSGMDSNSLDFFTIFNIS